MFSEVAALCPECARKEEKAVSAEGSIPVTLGVSYLKAQVTLTLIALNVLVFLAMVFSGVSVIDPSVEDLIRWGGNLAPLTITTEFWRLLTAAFVHAGIIHLLLNLYVLFSVGPLAERLFGRWGYLALYLMSGVGAGLVSLWWHPMVVGVGASGAIFGVAGALISAFYFGKLPFHPAALRKQLQSLLIFAGYNLFYGFKEANVDNAAHVGGFLVGLLLGIFLWRPLETGASGLVASATGQSEARRYGAMAAMAALLVTTGYVVRRQSAGVVKLGLAQELIQAGRYDEALPELEAAVKAQPELTMAQFLLGELYVEKERYAEAVGPLEKVLQTRPNMSEAQNDLAVALLKTDRAQDALPHIKKAVELEPRRGMFQVNLGATYLALGDFDRSIASFQQGMALGEEKAKVALAQAIILKAVKQEFDDQMLKAKKSGRPPPSGQDQGNKK